MFYPCNNRSGLKTIYNGLEKKLRGFEIVNVKSFHNTVYAGGKSVVVYDGKIFAFSYNRQCYVFDGDEWQYMNNVPIDVGSGNAIVYRNKIHLIAGNSHYSYDGVTWIQEPSVPNNLINSGVVVYDDKIYVISGQMSGSSSASSGFYVYDGSTWSSISGSPIYSTGKINAVVYNNKIHILGASVQSHYTFDGTNWAQLPTLPEYVCSGGCVVVYHNEIHAFLRNTSTTGYGYHYKWNGDTWTRIEYMPSKAALTTNCNVVVYNEQLRLIMGGGSYPTNQTVWFYDKEWVATDDSPHGYAIYPIF